MGATGGGQLAAAVEGGGAEGCGGWWWVIWRLGGRRGGGAVVVEYGGVVRHRSGRSWRWEAKLVSGRWWSCKVPTRYFGGMVWYQIDDS